MESTRESPGRAGPKAGRAVTPDPRRDRRPGRPAVRRRGRRLSLACGALLAAGILLSAARVGPFGVWSYHASWYPLLGLLEGAYAWRYGRHALFRSAGFALSLFLWSAPLWFVFEALNLRLADWFYVRVPRAPGLQLAGYVLAFATVLPAVYLPYRWLEALGVASGLQGKPVPLGRGGRRAVAGSGALCLALPLWRPEAFYPLVWVGPALLLAPWNRRRRPGESLLGDLERGRYDRIGRLLLAGLAAGFLWEGMNAFAASRWIYTVPGLERGKLFEMPIPGFLGFPVFALGCYAAYSALVSLGVAVPGWAEGPGRQGEPERGAARSRARLSPRRTAAAGVAAAAWCVLSTWAVDRWTVASYAPDLARLPGAPSAVTERLRRAGIGGVRELSAADPERVAVQAGVERPAAARLVRVATLARLRGLGLRGAAALERAGLGTACDLARAAPSRVRRVLERGIDRPRAGHPRRVRVWIRAAEGRCRSDGGAGGRPSRE